MNVELIIVKITECLYFIYWFVVTHNIDRNNVSAFKNRNSSRPSIRKPKLIRERGNYSIPHHLTCPILIVHFRNFQHVDCFSKNIFL